MRRTAIVWLLVGALATAFVAWIARHTYWVDVKVPMPPKREARTNPFYAAERFAEALGARATRGRAFGAPSPEAIVVLSGWNPSLSAERSTAIQRWVDAGGRLVTDQTLMGNEEFERWSGIVSDTKRAAGACDDCAVGEGITEGRNYGCVLLTEVGDAPPTSAPGYRVCDLGQSALTTRHRIAWGLRDKSELHAVRVGVGRGSITVINASPFLYRALFDGDHGRLFVAATELRAGDEVYFLSDDDHPSLLAWVWRAGKPAIVLAFAALALMLWRGSVRFGPLVAPEPTARRSLAEQIRGTAQFTLRFGRGAPLHAACVRALEDAAKRRVNGYTTLLPDERTSALAGLTGFKREALAAAIYHPPLHRPHEFRRTIALVEAARRA
ncbi:MAG TPA: DUF4350 domain-containing protein, partial [Gemmatimonadaceae bacterium]|nr:DUF4350 domain-containing protein [Gemmatimonadaceae bacterium]